MLPRTARRCSGRLSLGYNPLPEAKTLAEQSVRGRTSLGLSQKQSAKRSGVDPGTLARWERGERVPTGEFLGRASSFLRDGEVLVRARPAPSRGEPSARRRWRN
ncbi:MAG: helix-turn-helix domain-containing protein [Bryobacteraceae bacterium]